MIDLKLQGTPENILDGVAALCPEVRHVLADVRARMAPIKPKREVYEYQAGCLYYLARQYNFAGARILEIGTALGYSAAIMATGAPLAQMTTLNPKANEVPEARRRLKPWPNVTVVEVRSQDYLSRDHGEFDLIFVDGDHAHVVEDLPWWRFVRQGGLFLFHDYSPEDSGRPCPPVFQAVNDFSMQIGQPLDVCVVDNQNVGLAGLYRQSAQTLMTMSADTYAGRLINVVGGAL